jgi:hypothetical protein
MVFFRTTNHMRFSYPVGHSYPSAEREPAGFTGWSNIHISSVLSNIQSAFLEHRNGPLRLSIKRSQRRCSNTRFTCSAGNCTASTNFADVLPQPRMLTPAITCAVATLCEVIVQRPIRRQVLNLRLRHALILMLGASRTPIITPARAQRTGWHRRVSLTRSTKTMRRCVDNAIIQPWASCFNSSHVERS